jgi:hypothetical protein
MLYVLGPTDFICIYLHHSIILLTSLAPFRVLSSVLLFRATQRYCELCFLSSFPYLDESSAVKLTRRIMCSKLRHCATSRKVGGGAIEFFFEIT